LQVLDDDMDDEVFVALELALGVRLRAELLKVELLKVELLKVELVITGLLITELLITELLFHAFVTVEKDAGLEALPEWM
jgi:hypothetical protein